ncbi:MAG: aminotransferase class IV [Pirellulales bacterium]
MVPASEAHLAIFDAGVVLGATVTEMTRTFHLRPFRLEDHLERLFRSLRYTRMEVDLSPADFARISGELVEHNRQFLADGEELGLVNFVTAGEYPTYAGMAGRPPRLRPTVCCHTFPLPFELWADKMQHGARLMIPATRHVPPQCLDPKIKYRSRLHYYLADKEAQAADPEATALLLDLQGNVTETAGANFLLVEKGRLVSPRPVNILEGVSRATCIELAGRLGIGYEERDLQLYHVVNADEAILTSTPYCLMPVTRVGGFPIGAEVPGPVFGRLLDAWSAEVGLDILQQIVQGAAARRRQAQGGTGNE